MTNGIEGIDLPDPSSALLYYTILIEDSRPEEKDHASSEPSRYRSIKNPMLWDE